MRLKDLKIGTQLRLGLGAILLLAVLLGALAEFQGERLWQATQGLYEHPLATRRALGELKADVLTIQRAMKDLLLTDDNRERQFHLQIIDASEAGAHRQLDILYGSYLGPRKDVDDIHRTIAQWKAVREESLQLVRAGQAAEAIKRGRLNGLARNHADLILSEIEHVSQFATARGDQFYREARAQKEHLRLGLGILFGVILLAASGIGFLLLRGIRHPLQELTAVAGQYRQGRLDVRARYASGNEFGALAAAFNQLAETLQAQMRRKEQAGQIAEVMLREQDLRAFCQELLKALLQHTGSQSAAIYLLNDRKSDLDHFESIGLGAEARTSFSATALEGEFGAALATRKIQRVTSLPAGTRLAFAAVSGDFLPREILTIPLLSGDEVAGVVSLASLNNYPEPAIQLVYDIQNVLTARLNGVLAFRKIQEVSTKLQAQNRELEAQQKELAAQTDELSEQNIELELQKTQLGEASRLKSAFLSNMSHELRTPLNSVIALSGVLNRRLHGAIPAEEHSYLEVIERNGKELLALINDILDLSRIEAGKIELSLSQFALGDLAAEVVATLAPQAREKQIALRSLVSPQLPRLQSDFTKCRHILQNLAGNAVKFTSAGSVEISAHAVPGGIRIAVTDTGIGIAPEHLCHIFDEFRQADESTSRNYGGSGLGLAIAKKFTVLLRGRITVESTPGQGSTFAVTLPLSLDLPTPAAPAAPGNSTAAPAPQGRRLARRAAPDRKPVLLLVEDSEPAVIQITDILTEQGYQVQVARNGQEALDQIEQTVPDAMILDLMMPGVDGFQVLRSVRSANKTALLPVLILTAKHITREELSFLKGNHIQQLIQKGDISKAALLAAVAGMVSADAPPGPPSSLDTPAAPPRRPPPRPSGVPVILAVEDNADNLKTLRALLQETATLLEASSGQTGLELARARKPHLILLDIALPVMDGFQTLDALRQEETLRHIPVIALTARAMKGDREQILARGFDGYVSKPLDEQTLKDAIRTLLHGA